MLKSIQTREVPLEIVGVWVAVGVAEEVDLCRVIGVE